MGPVDVTDPGTTQDDWAPGEGWAPEEDPEAYVEYVDLAALERAHAHQVVTDALGASSWTTPAAGGGDDQDGDGENSEGDDYDPDEDPDADPDILDPDRHNRPETD
jgi:hypothetical protein